MQMGVEPDVVLFFDCPEDEMVKRVLNRNQVDDMLWLIFPTSKSLSSLVSQHDIFCREELMTTLSQSRKGWKFLMH